MQVSIREFKGHLSQYLNQAQKMVRPLKLLRIARPWRELSAYPLHPMTAFTHLLTSGAATWAGGKPTGANLRLTPKGTPVSQMVVEDRN
uniref:Uncharacterized protein n=1 Tax=Candidatus Kentrum sp. LFY TaxID=2126342 RepID=A0A450WWA7_9GAMM|nr:MAG: hypothetical protein BECKLFY1418C_GA0070996_109112 [Candidatus Kentron sp. LFY]